MTDVERFTEMLERAKISFRTEQTRKFEEMITVEAGYAGFVSQITFNPDGSLKSIEAYE